MNLHAYIIEGTNKAGAFCVSRHEIDKLWQEPEYNPLLDFALANDGHKPRMSRSELIKQFAEINNFDHWIDWRGDLHFRKRSAHKMHGQDF